MMRVEGLDHVNICTDDIEASARFYADILGLEARDGPPGLPPDQFRWLHDAGGRAIVHLRRLARDGGTTGAIHHVALACTGREAAIRRLVAQGVEHKVNRLEAIGLTQVFVTDPHGILLELNFHDD